MNTNINMVMQDAYEVINDLPDVKSLTQLIQRKITSVHITHQFTALESCFPEPLRYLAVLDPNPLGVKPVSIYLNKTRQCWMCLDRQIEPIVAPSEVYKLIFLKAAGSYTPSIILITKNSIPNYDYSKDKTVGNLVKDGLGFSADKEFYAPKYDGPKNKSRPDRRATLYWNASVKTNQAGKASVVFYNSGGAKKLTIVVESADGRGNVGSRRLLNQ